jgi:beta-glucanase (GH16 family)
MLPGSGGIMKHEKSTKTFASLAASAGIALALASCASQPDAAAFGPADGAAAPAEKTVWADEFNGTGLDKSKWSHQLGTGWVVNGAIPAAGWGNNELEFYTDRPENISVADGVLTITARKGDYSAKAEGIDQKGSWTSARIRSAGKFSRAYGKIEVRAKLPIGQGFWPAIWLLPEEPNPYGSWAASGEIDLMEAKGGKPDMVMGTLHYGGQWPKNVYTGDSYSFPFAQDIGDWHVYALEWRAGEMKWFVDGNLYQTQSAWWSAAVNQPAKDADLNAWPAPFDRPFHIILNLAVGGNFGGNPDKFTDDTGSMQVDFVRVYALPDETRDPGPRPAMKYPWTPKTSREAAEDGNMLANGHFDQPHKGSNTGLPGIATGDNWELWYANWAMPSPKLAMDGGLLRIDVTKVNVDNDWHIQFMQKNLPIEQGRKYTLQFDAKADTPRRVTAIVGEEGGGYARYNGPEKKGDSFELGTEPKHYTFSFTMESPTNKVAMLQFLMAAGKTGDNYSLWLGNLRLAAE